MPMVSNMLHFQGSTILSPVSSLLGLSIDKVNFFFGQVAIFVLGIIFRNFVTTERVGTTGRYLFHMIFGTVMLWFCYGPQLVHVFIQTGVAYLMMLYLSKQTAGLVVMIWALFYLSVINIYRTYNDYGGYTLDISGALMIQTQKISGLALSLWDFELIESGHTLSTNRRNHAVKNLPMVCRYFTYVLFLPSILAGPFAFYSDFDQYFDGTYHKPKSMFYPVLRAVGYSVIYGILFMVVMPMMPYDWILSDAFIQSNFAYKLGYTSVAFFLVRSKYYFAWTVAEIVNLAMGFGYSGLDEKTGEPQYYFAKTVDFWKVEFAKNLRDVAIGWNIPTHTWLRECVYERMPLKYATLCTFILSGFFHGFYPGYYCFSMTFALLQVTSLRVRKTIRPLFQDHPYHQVFYNIVTKVGTHLIQTYVQGVFFVLEFGLAMKFWASMYFYVHIGALILLIILPPFQLPQPPPPPRTTKVTIKES